MMITIKEGTAATYPSKQQKGKYVVQFSLRGGKTYLYTELLEEREAERLACDTARQHPRQNHFERGTHWR